jgi:hypothetical protein
MLCSSCRCNQNHDTHAFDKLFQGKLGDVAVIFSQALEDRENELGIDDEVSLVYALLHSTPTIPVWYYVALGEKERQNSILRLQVSSRE